MVNTELWHKRPTYADIVKEVANEFPVKLPERAALHFYDSFAMTKFREMQAGIDHTQSEGDSARNEAMVQAASEGGVSKRELLEYVQALGQQKQSANQQLRDSLQKTADHHLKWYATANHGDATAECRRARKS